MYTVRITGLTGALLNAVRFPLPDTKPILTKNAPKIILLNQPRFDKKGLVAIFKYHNINI